MDKRNGVIELLETVRDLTLKAEMHEKKIKELEDTIKILKRIHAKTTIKN